MAKKNDTAPAQTQAPVATWAPHVTTFGPPPLQIEAETRHEGEVTRITLGLHVANKVSHPAIVAGANQITAALPPRLKEAVEGAAEVRAYLDSFKRISAAEKTLADVALERDRLDLRRRELRAKRELTEEDLTAVAQAERDVAGVDRRLAAAREGLNVLRREAAGLREPALEKAMFLSGHVSRQMAGEVRARQQQRLAELLAKISPELDELAALARAADRLAAGSAASGLPQQLIPPEPQVAAEVEDDEEEANAHARRRPRRAGVFSTV